MHRSRLAVLALLATLAAAPSTAAQVVHGELREEGTGTAVSGAFVVLVDDAGRTTAAALSDGSGGFALAAPHPGRYAVRAERVGYAVTASAPLELGAGETVPLRLTTAARPVLLQGVVAKGDSRGCQVRPGAGSAAAVWEEARKALAAAAWTQEQELVRFALVRRIREMDLRMRVTREAAMPEMRVGSRPFESPPARLLADSGYVFARTDGTMYTAPDARVLLSDEFLDLHCFQVEPGQGDQAGHVGLAFLPVRGRGAADIAGTIWLDARTSELRHLEFRYVGLRMRGPTERLGGRVEFERLPTGAWIVRRWWIRTPVVALEQAQRMPARRVERVVGFREIGGEVTEVLPAQPRRPVASGRQL